MSRVAVVVPRVETRAQAGWMTTRMRFSSGSNEHSAAPTDAECSAPTRPALRRALSPDPIQFHPIAREFAVLVSRGNYLTVGMRLQ